MKSNFQHVLKKYNDGTASDEEKAIIESWYLSLGQNSTPPNESEIESVFISGEQDIQQLYSKNNVFPFRTLGKVAAAILILVGIYVFYDTQHTTTDEVVLLDSIVPGREVAHLQTANGEEIDLKSMHLGEEIISHGVAIMKLADGRIQISKLQTFNPEVREENIIRTPKGGEFEIALPDNSLVKLNANSELHFYSDYNDIKREVKLLGEAYFEVEKSKKPFIVTSQNQQVTVLGTKFNIKAYPFDDEITTKLVHGSVKVKDVLTNMELTMIPGDQVVNKKNELLLTSSPKQQVDWVNSEFSFTERPVKEIMKDISRWYDVDVEFDNEEVKNRTFSGTISRYSSFNKVIEVLEKTETLTFEVEGRKIIVK